MRRHRSERAFSLVELMGMLALLGVVLGVAFSQLEYRSYALWDAQTELLANFRRTRANALTKGDHYRLDILSSTSYAQYHLVLNAGNWVVAGPAVTTRTLPDGVTFVSGAGSQFEFNTRGLLITPGSAATLVLTTGTNTRNVTVWPSGQVAPL